MTRTGNRIWIRLARIRLARIRLARIRLARRDGRATLGATEPVEIGIKARQRVIHHLPDLPKRVARRNALLKVHIAEKRTCRPVRSPHHHPSKRHGKSESRSSNPVEGRRLQQPAKCRNWRKNLVAGHPEPGHHAPTIRPPACRRASMSLVAKKLLVVRCKGLPKRRPSKANSRYP